MKQPIKKFRPSNYTKHSLYPILKQYRPDSIAESLQCSRSYLEAILYGYKKPSDALEERIQALATSLSQEDSND